MHRSPVGLFLPVRIPTHGDISIIHESVKKLMSSMNSSLGWDQAPLKDSIKVTTLGLGLTNQLYKSELDEKANIPNLDDVNMKVIVRVFGDGSEEMLDRDQETNIMRQVEKDYVKCNFENGIVVSYFPGECFRPLDLIKKENKIKIATKLAALHKLTLKNPNGEIMQKAWFERLEQWLHIEQLHTLKKDIESKNYDIMFSHSDVNAENIIWEEKTDKISFIDFEYACNFFAGFDIGNHFCEYAGVERDLDFETYFPSVDQQKEFITYYCMERFPEEANMKAKVDVMWKESLDGVKCSHFFWGIWGLVQDTCSQLDFDFTKYGERRLQEYLKLAAENTHK